MAIILDGSTGISSIGTLTGVTSISSASANTPVILGDSGTNYNTCRAWVNFNGTSTVAIRASFNVSSITDNGTGDYTVNFTTAMPDANYTTVAQTSSDSGTQLILNINSNSSNNTTPTTTATRMYINSRSSGTATDSPYVNVAIFR
jgi:hypothetical protein